MTFKHFLFLTFLLLHHVASAQIRDEVHHIITSDSVELYVHVRGQGEPCLYLHGGSDCGHFAFIEVPDEWNKALDDYQRLADSVCAPLPKEKILLRVNELKSLIGKKYWPTFDNPEYTMEMNYYEEGPFRMHLVQDGSNKPRMECCSPEITFKSVPGVKLYEEWYAMLIHEFFHAFQHTKYPAFWNKMIEVNPKDFYANDSLMALKHYDWYNELLVQENVLLEKMYAATDIAEVRQLFKQFLPLRNKRLQFVKEKLGLDITLFYPITEANEGSARYIEYCLYKEQGLTQTEWMFDMKGYYFYASGLYMLLIMDKFGIEYKNELFDKYFTLTDLLSAKLSLAPPKTQ